MPEKKREEIYFYLDLTKNFIKRKDLSKLIENFITKRNEINKQVDYGLLFFDNQGSPIFVNQKQITEEIINLLEEKWDSHSETKSYFEKGLFYILSDITENIRRQSKIFRIIILSDTPSKLSEDYQRILFDIVSKVKYFPTYMEIIRLSKEEKRFFRDEVKLNILVSDTNGDIFQVKNKKELKSIFNQLINPKGIVNTFINKQDQIEISNEDLLFYSNLAKSLKEPQRKEDLICYLCNEEICPICLDVYDLPQICEDCGDVFHNCCILDYSIENNIGIPFIFRCPQCGSLLKLKKEDLKPSKREKKENHDTFSQPKKLNEKKINLPKVNIPEPIHFHEYNLQNQENEKYSQGDYEDEKLIRIGGFFGKTYKVVKKENKLIYRKLENDIDDNQ